MKSLDIIRYIKNDFAMDVDVVAEEEPLAIDIIYGPAFNRSVHQLSTTMRTPGHDQELALGLLFSLGIIDHIDDISEISHCKRGLLDPSSLDRLSVHLHDDRVFSPLDFSFGHPRYSSCGVCASSALPSVRCLSSSEPNFFITKPVVRSLSDEMIKMQKLFQKTGGVHAACLFDENGLAINLFEDVGRHNALDKLIGSMLSNQKPSLDKTILLMSSRASYEIIQKAACAHIPIVAVMGAVSSLAVSLAIKSHMTLIGFLRSDRFNVYSHEARIAQG